MRPLSPRMRETCALGHTARKWMGKVDSYLGLLDPKTPPLVVIRMHPPTLHSLEHNFSRGHCYALNSIPMFEQWSCLPQLFQADDQRLGSIAAWRPCSTCLRLYGSLGYSASFSPPLLYQGWTWIAVRGLFQPFLAPLQSLSQIFSLIQMSHLYPPGCLFLGGPRLTQLPKASRGPKLAWENLTWSIRKPWIDTNRQGEVQSSNNDSFFKNWYLSWNSHINSDIPGMY